MFYTYILIGKFCHANFAGSECKICDSDYKYGPQCDRSCSDVCNPSFGKCDAGVLGIGKCTTCYNYTHWQVFQLLYKLFLISECIYNIPYYITITHSYPRLYYNRIIVVMIVMLKGVNIVT